MDTSWKLVFAYRLSAEKNAQTIYDALFKAALKYRFRRAPLWAVPVNSEILTNAIFDLDNHDTVPIGLKTVTGQQLKELFITTLFLKQLERQFKPGAAFFMVLPETDSSCDTAVMVVEKENQEIKALDAKRMKLPQEHVPFLFQVKEYVNYEQLTQDELSLPQPMDMQRIEKKVVPYSENVLFFMRELFEYRSDDFKEFLEKHPNCFFLSSPYDITRIPPDSKTQEFEPVPLDSNKHNYVLTLAGETFAVVSFERPKFLVDEETMKSKLRERK
ncbi:MAG: hypothetical protein WEA04_04580 [Candidatus Andersenbacteria bacterium]